MITLVEIFVLFCHFHSVFGIGEILNSHITAVNPNAACSSAAFERPCFKYAGDAIEFYPENSPCPCPADGLAGGAIYPSNGQPSLQNPNAGEFIDEVLVDNFINPVGMSFTDNTNDLFVITKEGIVWKVKLGDGTRTMFIDLQEEVGNAGDRGMLGVTTHPNFAENPFVFLLFTVDPIFGQPDEPMEMPANQRLIRLEDVNDFGAARINLIGGGENDGIPICFNTHAIGSVKFGLDGSLFVSSGEGAHWDFDLGDFGQNQDPYDYLCEEKFGDLQDVGAFRSQSLHTLGGKLLRIKPDTGEGICENSGYPVLNPFCDGDANSIRSRIWALGFRNPLRINVRPWQIGEVAGGPGVVYFGDVGEGGYEEVNAVTQAGQNFGWPCWEGPLPMPRFRDSPLNFSPEFTAKQAGQNLSCSETYKNLKTELPFFFWNRYSEFDDAGYFKENGYLGQGFNGNAVAGVVYYNGDKYPDEYKGSLFMLDFGQWWIRVAKMENDIYTGIQDFLTTNTAIVTLETEPIDGNICYITLNGGTVRCIKYVMENVAPSISLSAFPPSGIAPFVVQFSSQGTFDRENDPISFVWDFGDGVKSTQPNPTHLYNEVGVWTVTLVATDKFLNSANKSISINSGNLPPTVRIVAPTTNDAPYFYSIAEIISFSANITDDQPGDLTHRWEVQIVHLNHIHTDQRVFFTPTFQANISNEGAVSHRGERINYIVQLTVTDSAGISARDSIYLTDMDWETIYGNSPPICDFEVDGFSPFQVGQPILFNARNTIDPNLDYIWYTWDFGDGFSGKDRFTSHIYGDPGTFNIILTTYDNFWGFNSSSLVIQILPQASVEATASPPPGKIYSSFFVALSTIQEGATIFYTLDGSDPTISSQEYVAPIFVPFAPYTNFTVKSITVADGLENSPVVTSTYNILPPTCNQLYIKSNCSLACYNTETPTDEIGVISVIPSSNGVNSVGNPPQNQSKILRYLIDRVYGEYDPELGTTRLHLYVNGLDIPGQAVQARIRYDFQNDGVWDRTETFNLFACDPSPETFEVYTFDDDLVRFQPGGIVGTNYLSFQNGTIQIEIWQAIGSSHMLIKTDGNINGFRSLFTIPYDHTFQDGPVSDCSLRCPGNMIEDECQTCDGPGRIGCDLECYSTQVNDSCGVCGGPGPIGCDQQCFSNKTVGSCGLCGEEGDCIAPSPACNELGLRFSCNHLVCRYLNYGDPEIAIIPSSNGASAGGTVPSNKSKVIEYQIQSIFGFYNFDERATKLHFYLDSGLAGGTGVQCRVSYDWTSDGLWDRLEIFQTFAPNDLPGFELWQVVGLSPPDGNLLSAVGEWGNLENGTIRVEFWSAHPQPGEIQILVESATEGKESYFGIPYITSFWNGEINNTDCDPVIIPEITQETVLTSNDAQSSTTEWISTTKIDDQVTSNSPETFEPVTSETTSTQFPSETFSEMETTKETETPPESSTKIPTTETPTTKTPTTEIPTTEIPTTETSPTTSPTTTNGIDEISASSKVVFSFTYLMWIMMIYTFV